jgi:hypothetical protein
MLRLLPRRRCTQAALAAGRGNQLNSGPLPPPPSSTHLQLQHQLPPRLLPAPGHAADVVGAAGHKAHKASAQDAGFGCSGACRQRQRAGPWAAGLGSPACLPPLSGSLSRCNQDNFQPCRPPALLPGGEEGSRRHARCSSSSKSCSLNTSFLETKHSCTVVLESAAGRLPPSCCCSSWGPLRAPRGSLGRGSVMINVH